MTEIDLALRLGTATLVGALIGLNRDLHGKPAGVRTHALVGLGSALIVAVACEMPDPAAVSRVIQGLITGIGFLGAGVILHSATERKVHGLTTAAAIWVAALLGAGAGAGAFAPVLIAFVLVVLVLTLGGRFERSVHDRLKGDEDPLRAGTSRSGDPD
jgi:putative Mg2+ transporter-C (MgtC) family protein